MVEPIETITVTDGNDEFNGIENMTIEDDIGIPSDNAPDDGIAIGASKKAKIITTNSNQLCLAPNRIKKNIYVKYREEY